MRLFVALDLNAKVIGELTLLVHRLRPMAPIHWVHPQSMHLSLKYIGDWDEDRIDEVVDALGRVRIPSKVKVPLAGLGFFPYPRRPRVFWAVAENTPPLRQLASSVDARLSGLGIAPEVRPYVPHVTLGRLRGECDLTEMHEAIEELPTRHFGDIEPSSFSLYGSALSENGPTHRKIEEFSYQMPVSKEFAARVAVQA